ncbi:MAG: TlpA family protein disulfide reductase [Deltaproteobacteria bacterium CG07_land_8_20_14_0_80_38_7]|nr:MAG: TlpA family protein disulfide reductase [Deltaproteobacteria bacterium CG07_land_8_20_14_0_80_38_7]
MKKRYLIAILIAGVILTIMSAVFFGKKLDKGDIAPAFELSAVDGKIFKLDEYRGKIVLVHFWATWCDICRYELPLIAHISKEFKDKGLVVLSVLEDDTDAQNVKRFLEFFPSVDFPILLDRKGIVADAYTVYGVPESFLIDKDGVVLKRLSGGIDWDALPYITYFDRILKSGR